MLTASPGPAARRLQERAPAAGTARTAERRGSTPRRNPVPVQPYNEPSNAAYSVQCVQPASVQRVQPVQCPVLPEPPAGVQPAAPRSRVERLNAVRLNTGHALDAERLDAVRSLDAVQSAGVQPVLVHPAPPSAAAVTPGQAEPASRPSCHRPGLRSRAALRSGGAGPGFLASATSEHRTSSTSDGTTEQTPQHDHDAPQHDPSTTSTPSASSPAPERDDQNTQHQQHYTDQTDPTHHDPPTHDSHHQNKIQKSYTPMHHDPEEDQQQVASAPAARPVAVPVARSRDDAAAPQPAGVR